MDLPLQGASEPLANATLSGPGPTAPKLGVARWLNAYQPSRSQGPTSYDPKFLWSSEED